MEDKKYNIQIGFIILSCFILFSIFGFYRLNIKKENYIRQQQYEMMMEAYNTTPTPTITSTTTATPTLEEDLLIEKDKNNEIKIDRISNYKINLLTYNLNGVDCTLPFTVKSMVSFGYLFQDKIGNDENGFGYTYNQLSEYLGGNTYSSFLYTLSPNNQIISVLVKNNSNNEQMILNCDVYGISASTCFYGDSEVEPSFEMSNGLYLGMTEGDMIKIMGNYDASFFVDDEQMITRYQWYQSLDGKTISNILTCDVVDGYVQMLSVEI